MEDQAVPADTSFRVCGWNLGGADVQDLTAALREGTGRALGKRDVALVQEYPRSKAGWSTEHVAGLRLLTFRRHDMWRGTGLAYNPTVWGS